MAVPGAFGVDDVRGYGAGLLVGAPLGYVASRAVVRRIRPTIGEARAITLGGSWGSWQGFGWRAVLGGGEEEFSGDATQETLAAMVFGGAAGIAAGFFRMHVDDPFAEADTFVAPRTATETAIAEIWMELLGLERVGIHDNFLDAGGHSLVGIRVLSRIHKATGVRLEANALTLQTLEQLAAEVDRP